MLCNKGKKTFFCPIMVMLCLLAILAWCTYADHIQSIHDKLERIPNSHKPKIFNFASSDSQQGILRSTSSKSCNPIDFGGDAKGRVDSYDAINKCISVCVEQAILSPNGLFPGSRSFANGKVIRDAGGCIVNLNGGEFLISKSLDIPEYIGNMIFGYGSIVAASSFPKDSFLITVGGVSSDGCKVPQGSCNVDINFPFLFLDGSNVANALQINNIMGATVGPGGHEVMVDRCWLGETNFDFDYEKELVIPSAIAIQINGNDHFIFDTIIFSSKIGVEINGAANVLTSVHVWFPLNRALAFRGKGAMAFHITGGQNRFTGCYIDGGVAVFDNTNQQVWTNGFECCAALDVERGIILRGDKIGPGMVITNNLWNGGSIHFEAKTANTKPEIQNVLIDQNSFSGNGKGSRASITLQQSSATIWDFDFCNLLVFPNNIESVSLSIIASIGFPRAIIRPINNNCIVNVETDVPMSGSISVNVDTSTYDNNFI